VSRLPPLQSLLRKTAFLACFVAASGAYGAQELPQPLREASELYRTGHYDRARELALTVQKAFPHDLQALLILGRIDFEAGRLADAKQWFQRAAAVNRSHPLVKQYQHVFEEIEYRRGPISSVGEPSLPAPDKTVTADRFKKGWFGPNFLELSKRVPVPPSTKPDSLGVATSSIGIIYGRSLDFSAHQALQQKWYLKAYLLYKDLTRDFPENQEYRLGLAEAAIGMRRHSDAQKVLEGILRTDPRNQQAADLLNRVNRSSPLETHP